MMNLKLKGKYLNIPCQECGTLLKEGLCQRCKDMPINKTDIKSAIKKMDAGEHSSWTEEEKTEEEKTAIAIKTERMINRTIYI